MSSAPRTNKNRPHRSHWHLMPPNSIKKDLPKDLHVVTAVSIDGERARQGGVEDEQIE